MSEEEVQLVMGFLDQEQVEFILRLEELHRELEYVAHCSNLMLCIPSMMVCLFEYQIYSPTWTRQAELRRDMERLRTFYKEQLGWARFSEAENILVYWRQFRHTFSAKRR